MFHPSRGGVRGGKDQFKWDNVKDDKFRENYLGHSLKAPVGRWQKGKDLTWYAKGKAPGPAANTLSPEEQRRLELQLVKEEEEAAMAEMLGLAKPKRRRGGTGGMPGDGGERLERREKEELFKRGKGAGEVMGEAVAEGERVKGVGFGSSVRAQQLALASGTADGKGTIESGGKDRREAGGEGTTEGKEKLDKEIDRNTESSRGDKHGKESLSLGKRKDTKESGSGESASSKSESDSDSESHGDGSGKEEEGKEGKEETKSERKARKRREQRREKRRSRREEELSGTKGVSEKRLKRRRRELRLERKKERREEKRRRAEAEGKGEGRGEGGQEEGKVGGGGGSFEDMFKAGRLMVDRDGFVKERTAEWKKQKKHVEREAKKRDIGGYRDE